MLIKDIFSILLTLANVSLPPNKNLEKDFLEELIESQGYSVQKHLIWTEDGYQISLHRILSTKATKNAVLLQHGLLSCGAQWVVNKEKSLAFMLSNAGYDVWIINSRGTSLSKGHRTLSANNPEYWDFSFHELGYYDVPAAIDHILAKTKKNSLHFVGHSQGANSILITAITRPEYQSKIISIFLLQPAAFLKNVHELPKTMVYSGAELLHERNQSQLILHNTKLTFSFDLLCSLPTMGVKCTELLMNIFGGLSDQAENPQTVGGLYMKYVLNDVSRKNADHLIQLIETGKFQMFDYGPKVNRKMYNGSKVPPEYDLSIVDFPCSVVWGTIDGLAPEIDVKTLISRLKNVQEVFELPWNHIDASYSKNADKILHEPIINSFDQYVNKI